MSKQTLFNTICDHITRYIVIYFPTMTTAIVDVGRYLRTMKNKGKLVTYTVHPSQSSRQSIDIEVVFPGDNKIYRSTIDITASPSSTANPSYKITTDKKKEATPEENFDRAMKGV